MKLSLAKELATLERMTVGELQQRYIEVFGEAGVGARSAVGMAQLPLGSTTETELILELKIERG